MNSSENAQPVASSSSLQTKEDAWIEEYKILPDPQERLAALVSRSAKRRELQETEKMDLHRVPGCVSAVWVIGSVSSDGTCTFRSEADSPMVKGLVAFICDFYHHEPAALVASHSCQLIERMGLSRVLTPTRLNGLHSVVARIREIAQRSLPSGN